MLTCFVRLNAIMPRQIYVYIVYTPTLALMIVISVEGGASLL